MRSAASCGHPLQVIVAPRGALTWRLRVLIVLKWVWWFRRAKFDRLRSNTR
jgi:hypothetical protein